jgi:hypothetical protein
VNAEEAGGLFQIKQRATIIISVNHAHTPDGDRHCRIARMIGQSADEPQGATAGFVQEAASMP